MKNLWTFGDSQTEGFKSTNKWAQDYVQWKGYTPKSFGQLVAEKQDYNLINLGVGGSDNYSIFETFCKNAINFNKGDIIILGWSDVTRFRLALNNRWQNFNVESLNNKNLLVPPNEVIEFFLINRSEEILYESEVNNWIDYINHKTENKIIHWCHFLNGIKCNKFTGFHTISQDTNEEIKDLHFSEQGHLDLSYKFIELIKTEKQNFLI